MNYTEQQKFKIKHFRKVTGVGLANTKILLRENNWDFEEAFKELQKISSAARMFSSFKEIENKVMSK